eukprot:gene14394-15893_t
MVLAKEYRIPLPLSLEEYRIAQLYMIQKKSRLESTGEGSRVEILKNVPYTDGPGGSGQYTKKIYHIGSHIPGWLKSFLPKTALRVEEEAWNAYPYTKTRTTCPFVDKFYIDVETYYYADSGLLENAFNLTPLERSKIPVDLIDPVKDAYPSNFYKVEEDPKKFVSSKTNRGPLSEDWLKEHREDPSSKEIMCAYKIITVEFKYWGIQSKIEQYIQDSARKTVMVAHRQAWSWQDEWCDLTMDDIRLLELNLQKELSGEPVEHDKGATSKDDGIPEIVTKISKAEVTLYKDSPKEIRQRSVQLTDEIILGLRMTCIEETSDSSYETPDSDEDEFVDALEDLQEDIATNFRTSASIPVKSANQPPTGHNYFSQAAVGSPTMSYPESLSSSESTEITSSILLLVFHGGGVADVDMDSKSRDFKTFHSVFTSMGSLLYPSTSQSVALRLVECPSVCPEIVENLRKISVCSEEKAGSGDFGWLPPTFPLSCVPLLLVSSLEFYQGIEAVIREGNAIYQEFLESSKLETHEIKVCILADCVGAMLVYGALCSHGSSRSKVMSTDSLLVNCGMDSPNDKASLTSTTYIPSFSQRSLSVDSVAQSQVSSFKSSMQFCFDVSNFFCCGSPIGMILMKQYFESNGILPTKPYCEQVFNIFLPFDPVASRLEPLIEGSFSRTEPVQLPRYQNFPFSREILYGTRYRDKSQTVCNVNEGPLTPTQSLFNAEHDVDTSSETGELSDSNPSSQEQMIKSENWWGSKRVDYMLYCPDGLQQFPFSALTQLCYSSYWESRDMASFILWQLLDDNTAVPVDALLSETAKFQPTIPKEKWIKKRTSLKIKNMHPNHRANDVILLEGKPIKLVGKFVYGPIEVAALTGEKVDVYMSLHRQMENWKLLGGGLTDVNGRLSFPIPEDEAVPQGIHAVKMVVRGDHTCVDCNLAVISHGTEAVVFSIDGSFLAAYSLRAIDPKIRGGAVDVVRHWQELGYLIIYVTSRLLFQKHQVMGWLAQHNFPFGIVSFCESIRKDYQRHKQEFLSKILKEEAVSIHAAYGSSRDISIYASLGLSKEQIFIVGKHKSQKQGKDNFQVITEGYAAHLSELPLHPLSRHAAGQISSMLPWTCFGIPATGGKIMNTTRPRSSSALRFFSRKKSQQNKIKEDNEFGSNNDQATRCVPSSRLRPRR